MNIYRNKKTGATIESICKVSGKNWEKVEDLEQDLQDDAELEDAELEDAEQTDEQPAAEAPAGKPKTSRRGKK